MRHLLIPMMMLTLQAAEITLHLHRDAKVPRPLITRAAEGARWMFAQTGLAVRFVFCEHPEDCPEFESSQVFVLRVTTPPSPIHAGAMGFTMPYAG
jgi:hypothetical protein